MYDACVLVLVRVFVQSNGYAFELQFRNKPITWEAGLGTAIERFSWIRRWEFNLFQRRTLVLRGWAIVVCRFEWFNQMWFDPSVSQPLAAHTFRTHSDQSCVSINSMKKKKSLTGLFSYQGIRIVGYGSAGSFVLAFIWTHTGCLHCNGINCFSSLFLLTLCFWRLFSKSLAIYFLPATRRCRILDIREHNLDFASTACRLQVAIVLFEDFFPSARSFLAVMSKCLHSWKSLQLRVGPFLSESSLLSTCKLPGVWSLFVLYNSSLKSTPETNRMTTTPYVRDGKIRKPRLMNFECMSLIVLFKLLLFSLHLW